MGNSDASPERRASLQEVFPDEVADEARSFGKAQPSSQRNSTGGRRGSAGGSNGLHQSLHTLLVECAVLFWKEQPGHSKEQPGRFCLALASLRTTGCCTHSRTDLCCGTLEAAS